MANNYKTSSETASSWQEQLDTAKKAAAEFYERAKEAYSAYSNEKGDFPLHWSSINTIRPNLFYRLAAPRVTRKNKRKTNPTHIKAADILEANLERSIDEQPLQERFEYVVEQYLNAGLGQVWIRYGYEEDDDGEGNKDISQELALIDIVHYEDFLMQSGRYLDEVTWMARAIYRTRDEIKEDKRFKGVQLDKLNFKLSFKDNRIGAGEADEFARVKIWEIWCKSSKTVYFVCEDYNDILYKRVLSKTKKTDKVAVFKDFFPCPRPLLATCDNSNVYPINDFTYYKQQSDSLTRITKRSKKIADKGLVVKGFYDAAKTEGIKALLESGDNGETFHPLNMSQLPANFEEIVKMFPTGIFVDVLNNLYPVIAQELQQAYETTGLSDILRGQGDANETATAQDIKSNNAGVRIGERQKKVQRFIRDVYALKGEVIAESFHWRTLLLNAGEDIAIFNDTGDWRYPELKPEIIRAAAAEQQQLQMFAQQSQQTGQPMPQFPTPNIERQQNGEQLIEAIKLVREERLRHFAIGIETDATLKADEDKEKDLAIKFVDALIQVIQSTAQISQGLPELLPVVPEILMFVIRKFDKGREFEQAIEQALEQFVASASQPKPPPTDYNQMALQIEQSKVQVQQAKLQVEQMKMGFEQQFKQMQEQFKQQLEQAKLQLEAQDMAATNQREDQRLQLDAAIANEEAAIKAESNQVKGIQGMQEISIKEREQEHQELRTVLDMQDNNELNRGVIR